MAKLKIIVFSDLHGNLPALKAILKDIKNINYDKIICLGDTIGTGPNSNKCLDLIIDNNIEMLLGNHEMYFLNCKNITKKDRILNQKYMKSILNDKHKSFLKKCKIEKTINYNNNSITFFHYFYDKNIFPNPFYSPKTYNFNNLSSDYYFFGHDHKANNFKIKNHNLINVGSSGCTLDNYTFYTLIEINDKLTYKKVKIPFNRNELINDFKKSHIPNKEKKAKDFFNISL